MIFILSAENMALLAEEVCGCRAEVLSGGLGGDNAATVIAHLWRRQPVLIPYPKPITNCHGKTLLWLGVSSATDVITMSMITGQNSFTVCTDMMKTITISRASGAATERTGRSLQVRRDG